MSIVIICAINYGGNYSNEVVYVLMLSADHFYDCFFGVSTASEHFGI